MWVQALEGSRWESRVSGFLMRMIVWARGGRCVGCDLAPEGRALHLVFGQSLLISSTRQDRGVDSMVIRLTLIPDGFVSLLGLSFGPITDFPSRIRARLCN